MASVLIGNSCQTQTLQGLGRMGVPGTCVWKMMLRYKNVLLEVASCKTAVMSGRFSERNLKLKI